MFGCNLGVRDPKGLCYAQVELSCPRKQTEEELEDVEVRMDSRGTSEAS